MRLAVNLKYGAATLCLATLSSQAMAANENNFLIATAGDLVALCGANPEEPNYGAAIHMCQGYVVGVAHFHQALAEELKEDVYCLPEGDARPSRNQAVGMFVEWAGNHPDAMSGPALNGLLIWAAEAFPCK